MGVALPGRAAIPRMEDDPAAPAGPDHLPGYRVQAPELDRGEEGLLGDQLGGEGCRGGEGEYEETSHPGPQV